jgi:hypothetical protein
MNEEKTSKEEIISLAKNTKLYCELLIAQSENWEEAESRKQKNIGNPKQYNTTIIWQ